MLRFLRRAPVTKASRGDEAARLVIRDFLRLLARLAPAPHPPEDAR